MVWRDEARWEEEKELVVIRVTFSISFVAVEVAEYVPMFWMERGEGVV